MENKEKETNFKKDFLKFLDKFKKDLPSESLIDKEFRAAKIEEWKRHLEPGKFFIDDSELVNVRAASRRDIRIAQNRMKLKERERNNERTI